MAEHKRFIVWADYGYEGWKILGESRDLDEAITIYTEAIRTSLASAPILTEYVEVEIVPVVPRVKRRPKIVVELEST